MTSYAPVWNYSKTAQLLAFSVSDNAQLNLRSFNPQSQDARFGDPTKTDGLPLGVIAAKSTIAAMRYSGMLQVYGWISLQVIQADDPKKDTTVKASQTGQVGTTGASGQVGASGLSGQGLATDSLVQAAAGGGFNTLCQLSPVVSPLASNATSLKGVLAAVSVPSGGDSVGYLYYMDTKSTIIELTLPGGELNEMAPVTKYSENSSLAATLVDHGNNVTDRYVAFQDIKGLVEVYGTTEQTLIGRISTSENAADRTPLAIVQYTKDGQCYLHVYWIKDKGRTIMRSRSALGPAGTPASGTQAPGTQVPGTQAASDASAVGTANTKHTWTDKSLEGWGAPNPASTLSATWYADKGVVLVTFKDKVGNVACREDDPKDS